MLDGVDEQTLEQRVVELERAIAILRARDTAEQTLLRAKKLVHAMEQMKPPTGFNSASRRLLVFKGKVLIRGYAYGPHEYNGQLQSLATLLEVDPAHEVRVYYGDLNQLWDLALAGNDVRQLTTLVTPLT